MASRIQRMWRTRLRRKAWQLRARQAQRAGGGPWGWRGHAAHAQRAAGGNRARTGPGALTDADAPPRDASGEGASQEALFQIFRDLHGEEDFRADGLPRVEAVRARLRDRDLSDDVGREEISEAFEAWQQQQAG